MNFTVWQAAVVLITHTKFGGKIVFFTFPPSIFISISSKFSDLNFASCVLYMLFTHVTLRGTHCEPGLPVKKLAVVSDARKPLKNILCANCQIYLSLIGYFHSPIDDAISRGLS